MLFGLSKTQTRSHCQDVVMSLQQQCIKSFTVTNDCIICCIIINWSLHFMPLNAIMSYANATRGINNDTLMTLEHECDAMQDA